MSRDSKDFLTSESNSTSSNNSSEIKSEDTAYLRFRDMYLPVVDNNDDMRLLFVVRIRDLENEFNINNSID